MVCLKEKKPEELLALAHRRGLTKKQQKDLLRHPLMPVDGLIELSKVDIHLFTRHPTIRLALATDRTFFDHLPMMVKVVMLRDGLAIGPGLVERFATDRSTSSLLRASAALSPHLTPVAAGKFLNHAVNIRQALATNPKLPRKIISKMLNDRDIVVRSKLAMRHDLKPEQYHHLAQDSAELVLWTLAANSAAPREIHRQFSQHDLPPIRVRAALSARNPNEVISLRQRMSVETS